MIPCPKCGNLDYHVARQCPQFDGAPVCIRCCAECTYYESNAILYPCRYHIYNPKPDYDGEIEKLSRQIETKERQIIKMISRGLQKKSKEKQAGSEQRRENGRENEMKKLKKLALRYNAVAYIYAAGALLITASPIITLWLLLYGVGCR